MKRTVVPVCALGAALLLVTPADAWAYVDPGTGSYLFQLAVAGFLAGVYTLRTHWHGLKTAIRSRLSRPRRPAKVRDER